MTLNGAPIRAGKSIITTGASPALPPLPGIDDIPYITSTTAPYITSTTALELEALPRSLIVLGGGYIGCELSQMFARMGVAVTAERWRMWIADGRSRFSLPLKHVSSCSSPVFAG